MDNYATKEEVALLKNRVSKAEIQAHIGINFAFIALKYSKNREEIIDALEKSYEAGLTELTFSLSTDEDIELFKNLYTGYIDQVRILSR